MFVVDLGQSFRLGLGWDESRFSHYDIRTEEALLPSNYNCNSDVMKWMDDYLNPGVLGWVLSHKSTSPTLT